MLSFSRQLPRQNLMEHPFSTFQRIVSKKVFHLITKLSIFQFITWNIFNYNDERLMCFTKWLLLYELRYIKNQALQSILDILV